MNYDIPHDTESYVHHIGRTGRAGRSGTALLFVSPRERHLLRAIEKATRQPLTEIDLPSAEDVNAQRVARFADSITENLGSDNLDLFREVVESYARDNDVAMADIAAALALETRDGGFLMAPDPPPASARRANPAPSAPRGGGSFATYRIAVGRKQRSPRGRLSGRSPTRADSRAGDFGNISIRDDFSLVELPADLDAETLAQLKPHPHRTQRHRPAARHGPAALPWGPQRRPARRKRGGPRDGNRRSNPKVAGRRGKYGSRAAVDTETEPLRFRGR